MKKNILIILSIVLMMGALYGCKQHPNIHQEIPSGQKEEKKEVLFYTCSMHPFIHEDKPGNCPICGMPLIPVYGEEEKHRHDAAPPETQPHATHEMGAPADLGRVPVKVSAEKQQLIGVRTEEVKRQALLREIDATGRVAFDPELYIAQSQYLISRKTEVGELEGLQGQLVRAGRDRLRLLGMGDAQIRELERRGQPMGSLVVPQKGEGVWIYGAIFENEIPWIQVDTPVQILIPGSDQTYNSHIASIDPTINASTRTMQVRIPLSNPSGSLRPDMYVKLKIQGNGGEVLAIPDNAILDTGKRQIVYVQKEEGKFEPREVKIGRRGTGYTEVLSGISEGEQVVINGNFLIDSESSLKATISGAGGGHQH